ncbi:hypothetical protein FO519_006421 [Halicephalobus sp. NKZ332]|nr:hypothetical protein FO519_006421 [Halicephalobus sp. NKZ332]
MNKDVVLIVGQKCRDLVDGPHEISIDRLVLAVHLKSLSIRHWIVSSIGQSLFVEERKTFKLIDCDLLSGSSSDYHVCGSSSKDILLKLCEKFGLPCVEFNSDGSTKLHWWSPEFCPHFLPIICVLLKPDDSCQFIYYRKDQKFHRLQNLNLFPHQSVDPNSQTFKFIVYQLVQLFRICSSKSFFPIFSLNDVFINNNDWVSVPLDELLKTRCLEKCKHEDYIDASANDRIDDSRLSDITQAWCQRRISNYEYLLKLNDFAGRKRHDKSRHPIFPWVCNFTSPTDGYRPLNRTKYRLAKGDTQLSAQFLKQKPSYHVPELLSDICYFVYRARIEPKEKLSKYVRTQWVPEEYPNSMARLYEWTPDECIPEFFEDPSIFKSTHEDMSDLQIPSFTETPEKFIEWHRGVLESEKVSSQLHHWIDLNFGYLASLSGKDAVNALNVHLSYLGLPSKEKFVGPVQLFVDPHPRRAMDKASENYVSNPTENPHLEKSLKMMEFPEGANLSQIFEKIIKTSKANSKFVDKSLLSIGITILELALPGYCRDLSPSGTFEDRLSRSRDLVITKFGSLPCFLRSPLKQLLVPENPESVISVSTFINDVDNFFFLPETYSEIHQHLTKYFNFDHLMMIAMKNFSTDSEDYYYKEKRNTLCLCIEIPFLKKLWLNLFMDLLSNKRIAALACYDLLPKLGRFYSREELLEVIEPVKEIFEIGTPNIMKILDHRFLLSVSIAYGTKNFLENFVPKLLEMLLSARDNLYIAIKDLILWVARRYGPILTASGVTSKLLCLLPLCYTENEQRIFIGNPNSISCEVAGDRQCRNILNCLTEIAIMFGPAFVTVQYLPFCADVYEQAKGRVTILPSWESAMIASVALLKTIVDCLTDKQLMDQLEDVIVGKILSEGRKILAYKTMGALHSIADRIGADNVQRHMSFAIQKLFSTFSVIYEFKSDGEIYFLSNHKQLDEIFTPNFALILLHIFSFTCGRQYTFSIIQNKDLILKLEQKADSQPEIPESQFKSKSKPISIESMSPPLTTPLSCSLPSGNRLSLFSTESDSNGSLSFSLDQGASENTPLYNRVNNDEATHLHGTWNDHFRAVLSSTTPFIPFDQIQLCTFSGHGGLIKKIVVLDNENSFITASNDKTIKLWSLKNVTEVGTCHLNFDKHSKSIQDVIMIESEGKIISTDSVVQIWDPFTDKIIRKSYDARSSVWGNRIATSPPSESCQGIRTFSISPNGHLIACALSVGCVSVLDLRIGKLLGFSATIDVEITQIEWLTDDVFVVLFSDASSKLFELSSQLKIFGKLEPASIIYAPSTKEFLTVQTSNRIRFYAENELRHEIKLRSDFIAGSVSSLSFLKMNKMFLIGSSTGMIRLACNFIDDMILQRLFGFFFVVLLFAAISSASGKIQDQDPVFYDDSIDFQNLEEQAAPDKRAYMRLGKRAYMRLGKRAYMRLGKRAYLRLGKRAPLRLG